MHIMRHQLLEIESNRKQPIICSRVAGTLVGVPVLVGPASRTASGLYMSGCWRRLRIHAIALVKMVKAQTAACGSSRLGF